MSTIALQPQSSPVTFCPSDNAMIPFNDAGFLYGDGLFETIRFDNNKLFVPEKHLKRLIKSNQKLDE